MQAESWRLWRSTGTVSRFSATRLGIRRRSSAARPRSSAGDISRRAWVMNGSEAASVSSEERTPGSASRANARRLGSDELSEASAGCAVRSVSRSSGMEASSAASSRAKAPAVTLKLVIRSFSARSSRTSAANVRAWPLSIRCRSRAGSWPSVASFASALLR